MNPDARGIFSQKRVGVIGGNSPDAKSLELAEEMGRLIARHGYILVNGGMKGVMEASARGAREAGGFVLAILPGKSVQDRNAYTDLAIATGLGYLRNALVVLNADILVAIDGAYGTLSEIAYAKIYDRPVFGLNSWNVSGIIPLTSPEEIIKQVDRFFKKEPSS